MAKPKTAMAAALDKAGFKKDEYALYASAVIFFQGGKTLDDYIRVGRQAIADMKGGHGARIIHQTTAPATPGAGQSALDNQVAHASARPQIGSGDHRAAVSEDHSTRVTAPAGGDDHPVLENQRFDVVPVRAHNRKTPNPPRGLAEQMQTIAISKPSMFDSYKIGGELVADISYERIASLVRENAGNAASYLRLGTEATENAILLDMIAKHGIPPNQTAKVRELLTPAQFAEFVLSARKATPLVIERGMRLYAKAIENREIDHAA
jgi:hypothetical protein